MTGSNSLAALPATVGRQAGTSHGHVAKAGNAGGAQSVLHVAGIVDERAFAYIGSACRALDALGIDQMVVMFSDERYRRLYEALPARTHVVYVPQSSAGLFSWLNFRAVLQKVLAEMQFSAVHLHGLMPCLISAFLLQRAAHPGSVFYSPHGSKSVTSLRGIGRFITRTILQLTGASSQVAVATVPHEAHWLRRSTGTDTDLLEAAVDDAYFRSIHSGGEIDAETGANALVVATSGNPRDIEAVDRFIRLAIFLASEAPLIRFRWIGDLDAKSRARLKASGVEVIAESDDAAIARQLANVSVYVQTDTADGFPIHLASAMAAGCACVVYFSFPHVDLIRHGSTGLVAHTRDELIRYVGYLLENQPQRESLAQLARSEAQRRFQMTEFRDAVLRLYGFDAVTPEPGHAHA